MKPRQEAGICHSARCPAAALLCGLDGRGSLQKGTAGLREGRAGPKGLTPPLSAYKSNTRQMNDTHIFLHTYFSMCAVTAQLS